MAENKEVVFGVEVDGVEKGINSLKDLKKAIKDAKDEQLKAATAYGEGSAEYLKASKAVANLKDKMEDLSDTTQSLKGSGVEGLTSSFGLLGDGLKSFDFDKIKTGFKGVGAAMSAIPIFLIITGITLLAEKFGIIEIVVDALVDTFYALTDALGITHKAQEELTKATVQGMQEQQKAVEERYNAEIKLAKAAGKDVSDLEVAKAKASEASIFNRLQALRILAQQKGQLNEEEKTQYKDLQIELVKASGDRKALEIAEEKQKVAEIRKINEDFSAKVIASEKNLANAKLSDKQREIQAIKDKQTVELEALQNAGKQAVNSSEKLKLLKESEKNINELAQIEINKINSKYYQIDLANKKKISDDKARQELEAFNLSAQINASNKDAQAKDDARLALEAKANEIAAINQLEIEGQNQFEELQKPNLDLKEARRKNELEAFKADKEQQLAITKQGLQATQAITDIYFAYRLNKVKGDEKAELEVRKKQFQVNKAFGIVNATIDGIGAVQKALNNPYPLNIVLAAISGIAAAANIAKIASTKFDGGSASSGGGISTPSAPNISSAPVISTNENNLNQQTQFDQQGNRIDPNAPQTININASVGVDEINEKQYRVQVIETRARF